MTIRHFALCYLLCSLISCSPSSESQKAAQSPPNIVFILADDLGYGDLSCYSTESKIPTLNLDRLASEGIRFTDAHTPSAVCTPTRYGILTGRYCWRSRLPTGVVRGYGPAIIEEERTTVASLLQEKGYHTACVGKWHLGVDWAIKGETGPLEEQRLQHRYSDTDELLPNAVDFSRPVHDGPNDHGFDYSWVLPASLDMDPYCYLQNGKAVTPPDTFTPGNDLNTGYTEAFWREGKIAADFDFYEVLPTFIRQSKQYLSERAQTKQPFFLYLPLASPHTPWVPKPPFAGSTEVGSYGDFVRMVDDYVGQVLAAIDSLGLRDNTLVVFTSDNGPFWRPNMIERYGHDASGIYRGMKADIWDGGHRVPLIVRWPGNIAAGTQSDQLIGLTDFLATAAAVAGRELKPGEGEDSYNMLPVLLGESAAPIRTTLIQQSSQGHMAIRKGKWKLIPLRGSGGFSEPQTYEPKPGEPQGQLYDLDADPREENNLYDAQPEVVEELAGLLQAQMTAKGSR